MAWINSKIATLQLNKFNQLQVTRATSELQKASKEMTTGRKVDVFADLGPMAAVTLTLRTTEKQLGGYISANGVLSSKIDAMLNGVDSVRSTVQDIFERVVSNASRKTASVATLQLEATEAIKSIISILNQSYNGDHLFSGVKSTSSALTNWDTVNTDTGLSPSGVFDAIVGSGPTTLVEATSMVSDIDQIFASSYAANSDYNFESTFYTGKPALEAGGQPASRVSAQIEVDRVLSYGVQANDDPFREVLKGLTMLASVDPVALTETDGVYSEWLNGASEALSKGLSGALAVSTRLGFYQQVIEHSVTRQSDLAFVYQTQINGFEAVDPYEAATRLSAMETQLQAAYSVTSRISRLSILNYL
jgi:flagellar hook-associated protein 3 FlgL